MMADQPILHNKHKLDIYPQKQNKQTRARAVCLLGRRLTTFWPHLIANVSNRWSYVNINLYTRIHPLNEHT